jgi:hypothetical protein
MSTVATPAPRRSRRRRGRVRHIRKNAKGAV